MWKRLLLEIALWEGWFPELLAAEWQWTALRWVGETLWKRRIRRGTPSSLRR